MTVAKIDGINEVEPMLLDIGKALLLIPLKFHSSVRRVSTLRSYTIRRGKANQFPGDADPQPR
jgi:hypothetical protein